MSRDDDCTLDPKNRFTSRVEAYVQARPRYPQGVIDHLREAIGFDATWHVVDVGSGTGISCELFLQHGNRVTGVEPNASMRAAAEQRLHRYSSFRSVDASAEATTLADASADLVVAAQAFHWFDPAAARREFRRILRPGGWVLLMWNDRQLSGSPFLEAYERLLLEYGTDYQQVRHENVIDQLGTFFGGGHQRATLPNAQRLDLAGLRQRLLSSSYVPGPEDVRYEPMLAHLHEIFQRHHQEGLVTLTYRTEMYFGRLS